MEKQDLDTFLLKHIRQYIYIKIYLILVLKKYTYMLVQSTHQFIKVYMHVKITSLDLPLYRVFNMDISS